MAGLPALLLGAQAALAGKLPPPWPTMQLATPNLLPACLPGPAVAASLQTTA